MSFANLSKKIYIVSFIAAVLFAGLFFVVNANTIGNNEVSVQTSSITTSSTDHDDDHDWNNDDHKIKICHIPPGNENNPQTITIDKSALSAHLEHGDYKDACKQEPPKGSIKVCKITADEHGNVLYAGTPLGDSFKIFGFKPSITGEGGAPVGIIATSTFSIPLELNTKILNASTGNDAQCITYENLKLGDYYYGEEIFPNTGWLTPKYNDQFTVTVASMSDFYPYSGQLFTPSTSDDSSRNKNSDGNIVLSKERPNRTLIVLNAHKKPLPPEPNQGKLKICKWNDKTGDGKSATSTDDIPLANWNFDIKNATSSEAVWHLLTQESDGCSLSDLIDVGNYSIKEETKQDWNLTDVYVNGDRASNIPVSTTTDVMAHVLKDMTTRVDFYNHFQESATTTPSLVISATKIVCGNESDLPNWGAGGPDVASTTATSWVATHSSCRLEPDWKFQYASSTAPNPGDQIGEASGWNTFGPTNDQGIATTTITNTGLMSGPRIWVREVMQSGYIPFAGVATTSTVSAEMYCASDVLNYDNYDYIVNPKAGNTYSCVAWNVKSKTPPQAPQCSDNIDNDSDGKIDATDSACHTDGNPDNPTSYDPNGNTENSKPTITLIGNATTTLTVGDIFTDPGATAHDDEDGDLTSMIHATSTVNMGAVGTYTVTYGDVVDSEGLVADPVTRVVIVNSGGGGGGDTGSIKICKIITDHQNMIATSSQGLPSGSFAIHLATSTNIASSTINTASFEAISFTPDTSIIGSSDAECVTYNNISLGNYYYGEETIVGSAWGTPQYNDGSNHPINNIFDFFLYDGALFTATTTDDGSREVNADGSITLTAGDAQKTLVVLNKYNLGNVTQCSDNSDNDGDEKKDAADPACHTDGNSDNPDSYDPNDNDENSKPVITLIGEATMNLTVGGAFTDPGATASDDEDGDLTSMIHATSTVNMGAVGTYTVTYGDVVDSKGVSASPVTRTVNVASGGGGGGGGGGGCVTNCGGGGGGGGGGNGPIVPTTLAIFNEKVTLVSSNTALVSWSTNLPATSQVLFDATSHATGTAPLFGYASATVKVTVQTTNHTLLVTNLRGGPPYYFRPISDNDTSTALGQELVVWPVVGSCNYLNDYLRIDLPNNPIEVNKLQLFLKNLEGFSDLKMTGIFDQATFDAVVAFQERYRIDVLDPWGHDKGTGYVYITTKKKVNEIYCKTVFPLNASQNTEIAAFKALLESIERGNASPFEPNSIGNIIGENTQKPTEEGTGTTTSIALNEETNAPQGFAQRVENVLNFRTGPLAALAVQARDFLSQKFFIPIILFIILIAVLILKRRSDKKTI